MSGDDPTPAVDVFCPRCRYNLRGLPDGHCPECGERFERQRLLVDAERPVEPLWRLGLAFLVFPAMYWVSIGPILIFLLVFLFKLLDDFVDRSPVARACGLFFFFGVTCFVTGRRQSNSQSSACAAANASTPTCRR